MLTRTRWGAILCMALITAAVIGWTAVSAGTGEPVPHTEPETDAPRVQIIPLRDLEPWDTDPSAEENWGSEWGAYQAVDEEDMAATLAETTLSDGTIVRLYATAQGLIDGAFSRPGEGWICFVHLFRGGDLGPNYADGATLTAYEDVMGRDGFLLRTDGYHLEAYDYWYYWFDEGGALQVLRAGTDPVSLDMDGDGDEELAFHFDQFRSAFSFYFERDGHIYRAELGSGGQTRGLERDESGALRLIFAPSGTDQGETLCALTFTGDALQLETGVSWEEEAQTVSLALPDAGEQAVWASITGPDGWMMDGSGDACTQLLHLLQGPVLVPADEALDEQAAYSAVLALADGTQLTWTMDPQGRCRFSSLPGTYQLLRTQGGSPPGYCYELLALYCQASRTSRDYQDGHWTGGSLAREIAAGMPEKSS